jgi:hypothetical protein
MVAREGGRKGEVEKSEKAWNLKPTSDDCQGGSGAASGPPPLLRHHRCSRSACTRSAAAVAVASALKRRESVKHNSKVAAFAAIITRIRELKVE